MPRLQKPMFDVAISYASEDIEVADFIAAQLRQDGYRCYYNPVRMHLLLGMDISEGIREIYGHPEVTVVAILSDAYWGKTYPMLEYRLATAGGFDRLIPVRIGNATMPPELASRSYADHAAHGVHSVAVQISHALAARRGDQDRAPHRTDFSAPPAPDILPFDFPPQPFRPNEVEFRDRGDPPYIVDILREELEFEHPLDYVAMNRESAHPAFAGLTRDDVLEAKRATAAAIAAKRDSGWPIFNGRKYGVRAVKRTRSAEDERHLLAFDVFETDYFTSQFAKHLYRRRAERIDINLGEDFSNLNRLICSFGFNTLLFAAGPTAPRLILSTRSTNVANAVTGGLQHVSMNEGVSKSDRYSAEFDASATIFRGLKEELGLNRSDIQHVDLYEPFLELRNCEAGQFATAYTTLRDVEVIERARRASDALLETANLFAIDATPESVAGFLATTSPRTNLLTFCLGSALQHELF